MTKLPNTVPIGRIVEESTRPEVVSVKVAIERVDATVQPTEKMKLERWLRFMAQQVANQLAHLTFLTMRAAAEEDDGRTFAAMRVYFDSIPSMLGQILEIQKQGAKRIEVVDANALDNLPKR